MIAALTACSICFSLTRFAFRLAPDACFFLAASSSVYGVLHRFRAPDLLPYWASAQFAASGPHTHRGRFLALLSNRCDFRLLDCCSPDSTFTKAFLLKAPPRSRTCLDLPILCLFGSDHLRMIWFLASCFTACDAVCCPRWPSQTRWLVIPDATCCRQFRSTPKPHLP